MKHDYKSGKRSRSVTKAGTKAILKKNQERIKKEGYASYITMGGYRNLYIPGIRHISEHKHIWIVNNGTIPKGFHIHHLDGNKLNNNINNLMMLSETSHKQLHKLQNRRWGK